MNGLKDIINIAGVTGVDRYILVDRQNNVVAHNLKNYRKAGAMVSFCGRQSAAIGKKRLDYLIFNRKNQKDLFIFPVGNYYLGVIKQKHIKTIELANNVRFFLNRLIEKKSQ